MPVVIGNRGRAQFARLFKRRSARTPDYSTGFAAPSTTGGAMIVEFLGASQSVGRCRVTIPSLSSAEAAQATTTARVNTGDRPRRVARVTMRRGPWRSTSASAMTRLTGGMRSSAGIGGRIDTMPFPDCIGERGSRFALPRNARRSRFRPAHLPTILGVAPGFGNTLSRQCATYRTANDLKTPAARIVEFSRSLNGRCRREGRYRRQSSPPWSRPVHHAGSLLRTCPRASPTRFRH